MEGIESCLLIVSHDFADETMHDLTRSARNFTRVMHLSHPRFAHLSEQAADGVSSEDEERGITKLKRHWWWLAGQVFDEILPSIHAARSSVQPQQQQQLQAATNPRVLFLEEDHVVAPDLLSTARELRDRLPTHCRWCWGLSLYAHDPPASPAGAPLGAESLAVVQQRVGPPLQAYMFDARFWTLLRERSSDFLSCRDGWDQSLWHMQWVGLLPSGFLQPLVSRVRNIGASGLNVDPVRWRTLGLERVRTSEQLFPGVRADWSQLRVQETEGFEVAAAVEAMFHGESITSPSSSLLPLAPHSRSRRPPNPALRFPGQC